MSKINLDIGSILGQVDLGKLIQGALKRMDRTKALKQIARAEKILAQARAALEAKPDEDGAE